MEVCVLFVSVTVLNLWPVLSPFRGASFIYLHLRFVSSLPLTDFQFTMSLSHDVPLATNLGHCLYVFGSIQRTGEKLLLQYNTRFGKV